MEDEVAGASRIPREPTVNRLRPELHIARQFQAMSGLQHFLNFYYSAVRPIVRPILLNGLHADKRQPFPCLRVQYRGI